MANLAREGTRGQIMISAMIIPVTEAGNMISTMIMIVTRTSIISVMVFVHCITGIIIVDMILYPF